MKFTITLLLLSFFCCFAFGQKIAIENGKLGGILPVDESGTVSYQAVEQVPDADKKELYQRARNWFVTNYGSAKEVLELSDPETGELSGRSFFLITPKMMGIGIRTKVSYLMQIETKDNRYRATVKGFYVECPNNVDGPIDNIRNTTKGFILKIYKQTDEEVNTILASLKKAATTKKADF